LKLAATPTTGRPPLGVRAKNDGHWLAVSAQNADRIPGAQTHLATDGTFAPENYARHRQKHPA
jgi:hypothetical protein